MPPEHGVVSSNLTGRATFFPLYFHQSVAIAFFLLRTLPVRPLAMNATRFTILIFMVGMTSGICRGQPNPAQINELSSLPAPGRCKDAPSQKMAMRAVLPLSVNTEKTKAGDHIPIRVAPFSCPGEPSIALLDTEVTYVQRAVKGSRSILRIRIGKALDKDGHELPVQVNVVALASQSTVTEHWEFPLIIADRFPRIPEDDERQPGERKLSEDDQRHTSPLDAIPDGPVLHTMVCEKKAAKGRQGSCTDLLEARGTYGYKRVRLESRAPTSTEDTVLSSDKNIRLSAGTLIILEVEKVQGGKS